MNQVLKIQEGLDIATCRACQVVAVNRLMKKMISVTEESGVDGGGGGGT